MFARRSEILFVMVWGDEKVILSELGGPTGIAYSNSLRYACFLLKNPSRFLINRILSHTLTKIIGKFGEKDRKVSPIVSKWEYFCQNWQIIREFWQEYSHFEKDGGGFLCFSYDFLIIFVSVDPPMVTPFADVFIFNLQSSEVTVIVLWEKNKYLNLMLSTFIWGVLLNNLSTSGAIDRPWRLPTFIISL